MTGHVYLDWNATAPLAPEARDAWLSAQTEAWANPASIHGPGQRARNLLDQSRATCARLLHCQPHELVWLSSGTEANATAIHAALSSPTLQNTGNSGNNPVLALAASIEHSSVLRNLELWCAAAGGRVQLLPVDGDGRLAPATVTAALAEYPLVRLVALHAANNETGTLQDLPALVTAIRAAAPTAKILADCCQGAGKIPLDLNALGVDYASVAGHKFGAPRGIGLLYVKTGAPCPPLIAGGRQQQDRRSGSEDVANPAALAAALTAAIGEEPEFLAKKSANQRQFLEHCWGSISNALPQTRWLAHGAARLPNTMNLVHPGCRNDHLVMRLDLGGIAVSTGAACMAARGEPSHVVAALGLEPALARSAVRVSIGPTTTAEDLGRFAGAYIGAVSALIRR